MTAMNRKLERESTSNCWRDAQGWSRSQRQWHTRVMLPPSPER